MEQHQTAHSNVKTYLFVFAGLGVLTGLTVLLSYMGLSHHMGIFLAACIAFIKCALIAAFFMHLKAETWKVRGFLFVGLLLVIVLIAAVIPDIGFLTRR